MDYLMDESNPSDCIVFDLEIKYETPLIHRIVIGKKMRCFSGSAKSHLYGDLVIRERDDNRIGDCVDRFAVGAFMRPEYHKC